MIPDQDTANEHITAHLDQTDEGWRLEWAEEENRIPFPEPGYAFCAVRDREWGPQRAYGFLRPDFDVEFAP